MNKETVRTLARETWDECLTEGGTLEDMFERFAALVEAEVREECAQVCDRQMDIAEINPAMAVAAGNCADAIRFGEAEG
jgi:hypothetical protein